jgi:hypothetical protein
VEQLKGSHQEYFVSKVKAYAKDNEHVVLRIETNSGSTEPRLLRVLSLGEDFFVGRGRNKTEPETFALSNIASWRFANFVATDWKW